MKINLKNKKSLKLAIVVVLALGLGFWAGYDYKAYEVRKSIENAFSNSENTTETFAEDEESIEEYDFIYHEPGEEVQYTTQKMKFVSAKSSNVISSEYSSPLTAGEGNKFVIVNHTVTNTTNAPFLYEPFVLLDKDNKQYNASDEAISYIDNYLNVRELAPNVPETGVVIFKVPKETKEFKFGGLKADTNELHAIEFVVN